MLEKEVIVLNEERDVKLYAYTQPVEGEYLGIKERPAVLILPGGGYQTCSDREAEIVAFAYMKAGYQAFVLRYSVKEHHTWPNPLHDYEQAVTMIREREDWHVSKDRVAVIGFSAGGHLAASAAAISKIKPNAAILGYAAVREDICRNMQVPSVIPYVDKDTPQCFLFAARDDHTVPIANTLDFEKALDEAGVMFESHIYAYGDHGFGPADSYMLMESACDRVLRWVDDSIHWLADVFGEMKPAGGFSEPKVLHHFNGDQEDYLSTNCTVSYIAKQEGAKALLEPYLKAASAAAAASVGKEIDVTFFLGFMTLKGFLQMVQVPEEQIRELDEKLKKIPNQKV